MWFQHLEVVEANQRTGAKKAVAKRERITTQKKNDEEFRDSDDDVCNQCYHFNAPSFENELNSGNKPSFVWLACSSCPL